MQLIKIALIVSDTMFTPFLTTVIISNHLSGICTCFLYQVSAQNVFQIVLQEILSHNKMVHPSKESGFLSFIYY